MYEKAFINLLVIKFLYFCLVYILLIVNIFELKRDRKRGLNALISFYIILYTLSIFGYIDQHTLFSFTLGWNKSSLCNVIHFSLQNVWHVLFSFYLLVIEKEQPTTVNVIKDEVLLTVGCPIFPPFYIDSQISVHRKFKKNRSVDL